MKWYRDLRVHLASSPRHPITRAYRAARNARLSMQARHVPIDRLLCGGELGLDGRQFAAHTGNLKRTSTPISESPHSKFLAQYQQIGDSVLQKEVLQQTDFYRNASECIRNFGSYFDARDEEGIDRLARNFIAKFNGEPIDPAQRSFDQFSAAGLPVVALPIRYSDCYQIHDGNHRLAIACARGEKSYSVRIIDRPQLTCLQQLLLDVSWNLNQRDLYQPMHSPELGGQWRLVRRCTDRREMMRNFLKENNLLPPQTRTYLDIACNYGWFVKSMGELGYDAQGLEIDWAARQIGIHFYGLSPEQIIRSEVVRYFRSDPPKRDVVSCFSLLHHFVMGRGLVTAEQMIRWLDTITGKVLFFEMGDEGEAWFQESLGGWNPEKIARWLRENTTFSRIIPLGTDQDRVAPFEENYHRTLFACMR